MLEKSYYLYDKIQSGQNKNGVAVLVEFGRAHHVVVILDLFVFNS